MNRDTNFTMTLTVTPADYCSVSWLLDGVEVAQGVTIDMNESRYVSFAGECVYRTG